MDKYDLDLEEKNLVGGIDRLLVNFGMAAIALFPTYFYLIFKPKTMGYMLRGEEADGRQGLKLGPGITFIFTILVILSVGYYFRDVPPPPLDPAEITPPNKGLRAAVTEGNFWRAIILSLPIYLSGLVFGVLFHISHRLFGKPCNLTLAVGVGLYVISTALVVLIPLGSFIENLIDKDSGEIYIVIPLFAVLVILPWQTFSFSKHAFGNKTGDAAAMALVCNILLILTVSVIGILHSVLN